MKFLCFLSMQSALILVFIDTKVADPCLLAQEYVWSTIKHHDWGDGLRLHQLHQLAEWLEICKDKNEMDVSYCGYHMCPKNI